MDKLKPTLARLLRHRLALLALLLFLELQFFTINMLNAQLRQPNDGWELKFAAVDDHLTPEGLWLIPYFTGFALSALVPLWAAYHMPIKLYRQFLLAMISAAVFSYVIYIVFPTYVTKPAPDEVPGAGFFAQFLRSTYEADAAASTHNAFPSQHVFYALLNMCFMILYRPRPRVFWLWVTLGTLITASTLLTLRHNAPDLVGGYAMAVGAYYLGLYLGARATNWLGDADAPIPAPPLLPRVRRRLARVLGPDAT